MVKVEIIIIIQGNIYLLCIAYLKYSVLKKIPIVFYDYDFIIKGLAEEFKNNLLV